MLGKFFEQRKVSVDNHFPRWDKKELSMGDVPTGISMETGFKLVFIVHK